MKKSNASFYGGVTLLIVLASFMYSWKFIIPSYKDSLTKVAQTEADITAATGRLESLKATQRSLDQLGDLPKQLFVSIPEDKDSPNLITELEAMAAKYKIVIPSIQISDGTDSGAGSTASATASTGGVGGTTSPNAVTISIAVSGSFEEVSGFANSIEKDIRFMNIKSLSISTGSDKDSDGKTVDTGKMNMSLSIEAYKRSGVTATAATAVSGAAASETTTTGGE